MEPPATILAGRIDGYGYSYSIDPIICTCAAGRQPPLIPRMSNGRRAAGDGWIRRVAASNCAGIT
jgi:hypothetical protein